jgi:hypothetical protein
MVRCHCNSCCLLLQLLLVLLLNTREACELLQKPVVQVAEPYECLDIN